MPTTSTPGFASKSSIEVVKLPRLNSWQRSRPSCSFRSHSWITFQSSLFSAPEMMLRPSPSPRTPSPSFFIASFLNFMETQNLLPARFLFRGVNPLLGKIVVDFALVALKNRCLFSGAAAVHRLLARLLEQLQNLRFVLIGQVWILRDIAGERELHLAVSHLVFDLFNLF